MMRTVLILLCALGLVAGNPPTPQEKAFAGLRIAIREGKTDKAKGMLHESARQWGKTFTERKGILGDQLLQTCAEAGNYEIAKDLLMKHDADPEFKDRKGGTAYSFCEKRRDMDTAKGEPEGCDPDLWVQMVEDCIAAREKGEKDFVLGPSYKTGAAAQAGKADKKEDGDTPEKQRERLAAYEAAKKAKESMTTEDKEKEKARKKAEMKERIAEKKRKKAEEDAKAKKEL